MIIFGTGQFADVADACFNDAQSFFTVHRKFLKSGLMNGKIIRPWDEVSPDSLYIAIGDNNVRQRIYRQAMEKDFKLVSFIDRSVRTSRNTIGKHNFIMELNNLQPHASIGNNNVLWAGNHIGHHVKIGNHCFITSHVVISGGTEIGDRTFIGVNATILDHLRIGKDCIIAAGAVVDRDVADGSVWGRDGLSKVTTERLTKHEVDEDEGEEK